MFNQITKSNESLLGCMFGESIVVKQLPSDHGRMWYLKCKCGNFYKSSTKDLNRGRRRNCGCERQNGRKTNVKIGDVFGRGTVISQAETKNNQKHWNLKCYCGGQYTVRTAYLINGHTKSCGCLRGCVGYEEIPGRHWSSIIKSANERGYDLSVTIEDIWKLYLDQNKKCALTGWDINFAKNSKGYDRGESTASLDRIDNEMGYIKGNLQWLHKEVNMMKHTKSQEHFLQLCQAVTNHV